MMILGIQESKNDLIINTTIYKKHTSIFDEVKIVFRNWKLTCPGQWCEPINDNVINDYEICVYHEPISANEEYSDTFTLETFNGDTVDICERISDKEYNLILSTISSDVLF